MTVEVIETLMNEILEPQKKNLKRLIDKRSWDRVLKNEFEIKNLVKPVISHLITKGIIKGEIYHSSGAVVNAKGSPYMEVDNTLKERPIYLLVQGPDEKALYWAVDRIKKLIKEAEEILNNDIPEVISEDSAHKRNEPTSHSQTDELLSVQKDLKSTSELKSIEQQSHRVVNQEKCFPPFMLELGDGVDADVNRCVVLVQWLLAHPLLVSFFAYPPKGLESKKVSKKLVITALLNLPLYDQYKCTHTMSKKMCGDCHKFFSNVQNVVHHRFEAVVSSGYDIYKLRSVDDYIKNLSVDSEQVGVLYDYPLPLNLFYMDSCRLFIDLVINCGLEIEESHIVSYLRSSKQWYPIKAIKKIVVYSADDTYNPSKNPQTHNYPMYYSLDHHGAMINFLLETIAEAIPGQLFPADAERIPKCQYFPFLNRLTVFSKLYIINKKHISMAENQTSVASNTISHAAYKLTKESLEKCDPYTPLSTHHIQDSYGSLGGNSSQPPQTPHLSPPSSTITSQHGLNNKEPLQGKISPGYVPSSFLTIRDPTVKPKLTVVSGPKSSMPSRIYRKEARKKKAEEKQLIKKLEVEKTIEMLKEKHGTNNFWTMDQKLEGENSQEKLTSLSVPQKNSNNLHIGSIHPHMTNTTSSPKLQQVLSNMQLSMPATQSVLFKATSMLTGEENKHSLEPVLLNTGQIMDVQTNDSQKSSQENSFSEVINELQEYIQASSTKLTEDTSTAPLDKSAVPQQSLVTSSTQLNKFTAGEQYSVDSAAPQESPFDSIIQQLQQYIDSNNQTSSSNNSENKKTSEDGIRQPSGSNSSDRVSVSIGRTQEHPQLKRRSTEHELESQPKRVNIEAKSNSIQEKPAYGNQRLQQKTQSPQQNIAYGNTAVKNIQKEASSTVLCNPMEKSEIFSRVSILSDSLLRRARSFWGGLDNKDIIGDRFTLGELFTNIIKYHTRRGILNPYCVLMCGMNDVINTVPGQSKLIRERKFAQDLKRIINYLHKQGYFVLLVTLPRIVSSVKVVNGIICSFQSKSNTALVRFHELFQKSLFETIADGRSDSVVLTNRGCNKLGDLIEVQMKDIISQLKSELFIN